MADNLSLLSAVLSFGYGDTHAASGIPSRRVYTLTERSAAAWSELLRLATVGGDVYSATERPGAIDAAVAFVEAVPTERLGRMQRAQSSKLLKHLATAKVSAMTRRSNPSESVRIMRSANPDAASLLPLVRRYFPSATVSRTDTDGSRRTAYVGRIGPARGEPGVTEHARIVWIEPGAASVRIRVYRYADPRIDQTLSAHVLVSERVIEPADLGAALAAVIAEQGNGARTGNPPALIWEFDGEPTTPKELLADNPDNGDVAAAVAYLKAEGAKFSMGRHGTKGVRSWSAVSFGGGAADESVLTVRAAWTEGPVFKAVLDASTIPYAGDLPDAD